MNALHRERIPAIASSDRTDGVITRRRSRTRARASIADRGSVVLFLVGAGHFLLVSIAAFAKGNARRGAQPIETSDPAARASVLAGRIDWTIHPADVRTNEIAECEPTEPEAPAST